MLYLLVLLTYLMFVNCYTISMPYSNYYKTPPTKDFINTQQLPHQNHANYNIYQNITPIFHGNHYLPAISTPPVQEQPIISKYFYFITAAEDTDGEEVIQRKHLTIGRPQKNYRIIFIKTPISNKANVPLATEWAPQEEKTIIYVLSKKEPELNVNEIIPMPPPTKPSKPEIYFIKYKNADDAIAVQQQIQGHYDKLGGTSDYSDEGIAAVKHYHSTNEHNGYHYDKPKELAEEVNWL